MDTCTICQETLPEDSEECAHTACGHTFHWVSFLCVLSIRTRQYILTNSPHIVGSRSAS